MEALDVVNIEARIYSFRDTYVMIDRDLAELYGVETKVLNQAVKRNIDRFPESFRFGLSKLETQELVTNCDRFNNLKHSTSLPYAFTEPGVAMLSAVLHSPAAVSVSVRIMQAFVAMRRFMLTNAQVFQRLDRIEYKQLETDKKIDQVFAKLEEKTDRNKQCIFFDGQIYDAYEFICDLIRHANKRIVLIDNYVDDSVLTMLDKRNAGVVTTVHTRYTEQVKLDFEKHNKQYATIDYVQLPHAVHDRYLIVDDDVWLLGTSVKDMGRGLCTVIKVGFSPEDVLKLV